MIKIVKSSIISDELFIHGFPERTGGVSTGLCSSLNFGSRCDDRVENVIENHNRLSRDIDVLNDEMVIAAHAHGTVVWNTDVTENKPQEHDGLVTGQRGKLLCVYGADCIPIVLCDSKSKQCGAAHSGWRGTAAGIAKNMVSMMVSLGSRPENICVALGPSIAACCFEVQDDVFNVFEKISSQSVQKRDGKCFVDLHATTRIMLEQAGVKPYNIDDNPPCTCCHPERFFSYRRDGKKTGSHIGFIGLR